MKKLFPLILSIVLGVTGFLYFNNDNIHSSKVEKVRIYTYEEYKSKPKSPSPFISLDKNDLINIVINTINSSKKIDEALDISEPNYVVDIPYSENKKDTFYLWISDDSNSGIYMNVKSIGTGYTISKGDATKLKTLLYR